MLKICMITDDPAMESSLREYIGQTIPEARVSAAGSLGVLLGMTGQVQPDMLFIDTGFSEADSMALAKAFRDWSPMTGIVMIANSSVLMTEAFRIHVQGFILKPVTEERVREEIDYYMDSLSRPAPASSENEKPYIRTSGIFECFFGGIPARFRYSKTKELLAYLVYRQGSMVTDGELLSVMWGSEQASNKSYLRTIKAELVRVFTEAGCGGAVIKRRGEIGIVLSRVRIEEAGSREYMAQYSWAACRA